MRLQESWLINDQFVRWALGYIEPKDDTEHVPLVSLQLILLVFIRNVAVVGQLHAVLGRKVQKLFNLKVIPEMRINATVFFTMFLTREINGYG